jgi:hypothetical protein
VPRSDRSQVQWVTFTSASRPATFWSAELVQKGPVGYLRAGRHQWRRSGRVPPGLGAHAAAGPEPHPPVAKPQERVVTVQPVSSDYPLSSIHCLAI